LEVGRVESKELPLEHRTCVSHHIAVEQGEGRASFAATHHSCAEHSVRFQQEGNELFDDGVADLVLRGRRASGLDHQLAEARPV
jgi:hypothetical protein